MLAVNAFFSAIKRGLGFEKRRGRRGSKQVRELSKASPIMVNNPLRPLDGLQHRLHAGHIFHSKKEANVDSCHISEVPPAAKEGRLRLQSGLWQAIHGRVYEVTA